MTLDEIREALGEALPIRTPRFEHGTSRDARVSGLEDYMLLAAYHHGALVEARHWLRTSEDQLSRQVDELQGYQAALPNRRGAFTKPEIDRAKRETAPELFAAGREARRLRGSVEDQIGRFEFEQTTLSRVYSLISGA